MTLFMGGRFFYHADYASVRATYLCLLLLFSPFYFFCCDIPAIAIPTIPYHVFAILSRSFITLGKGSIFRIPVSPTFNFRDSSAVLLFSFIRHVISDIYTSHCLLPKRRLFPRRRGAAFHFFVCLTFCSKVHVLKKVSLFSAYSRSGYDSDPCSVAAGIDVSIISVFSRRNYWVFLKGRDGLRAVRSIRIAIAMSSNVTANDTRVGMFIAFNFKIMQADNSMHGHIKL